MLKYYSTQPRSTLPDKYQQGKKLSLMCVQGGYDF